MIALGPWEDLPERMGLSTTPRYSAARVQANFFAKVNLTERCWEWLGAVGGGGYGTFGVAGTVRLAHRVAYALAYGSIPPGFFVCHQCDNPLCVNPGHLFLGTQADNMADMVAKGRSRRGEQSGVSRLTLRDVQEIRASDEDSRVLAARYGISRNHIWTLKRRASWTHACP